MRFLPVPPALLRGWLAGACLLLVQAGAAGAAQLVVRVEGVDEPLKAAVLAAVEAAQYGKRDVTEAQARRLLQRADAQAARALEPYGYFSAQARGTLDQSGPAYTLVLHVSAGEPTRVARLDIRIDADARDQREVRDALTAFAPAQGQVLDQAAYERSKAALQAALAASGYLDAQLSTHRIEVTRATRSAAIELEWQAGPRYRFGPTRFEGAQFPTALLDRYIPWREGDFYTQRQLLAFQQRLIDSDYYAMVQVDPAGDEASAGSVPIHVQLAPAKRTLYTGGVFVGTDTGPGVRGGLQRRWVNSRGHKLAADVLAALWLKTAATQYTIPLAGPDNHTWSFGVKYRDEDTDTASSRTFALAATDSRLWHGWTRTLGLKFLTGDFKVANLAGNTTLLYPEVVLARKHADEPLFVRDGWSLTLAARAAPSNCCRARASCSSAPTPSGSMRWASARASSRADRSAPPGPRTSTACRPSCASSPVATVRSAAIPTRASVHRCPRRWYRWRRRSARRDRGAVARTWSSAASTSRCSAPNTSTTSSRTGASPASSTAAMPSPTPAPTGKRPAWDWACAGARRWAWCAWTWACRCVIANTTACSCTS